MTVCLMGAELKTARCLAISIESWLRHSQERKMPAQDSGGNCHQFIEADALNPMSGY
jgi:hypothetical protein